MKSVMDIAIVQLIVTGLASYSEYDSNGHSYKVYMYVYCEYAELIMWFQDKRIL